MEQLIISLNGKSKEEIKNAGIKIFLDWQHIVTAMQQLVMLRPDELIEGYLITDKGIDVNISRKKGRKVTAEE